MNKLVFIAVTALCIAACSSSDPKDTMIPPDMSKWDTELKASADRLNDEEKNLLTAYLQRAKGGETAGGRNIPEGMTIRMAIAEQKKWTEEQAKKETAATASRGKPVKDLDVLRKRVESIITVTILELSVEKGSFEFDQQLMKLGFQNKGPKDIKGIKGEVIFFDRSDKEVGSFDFSYDEGVAAGKTVTWTSTRRYRESLPSHRALAHLAEGKYTTRFEPAMIVFSDGSKLIVKD